MQSDDVDRKGVGRVSSSSMGVFHAGGIDYEKVALLSFSVLAKLHRVFIDLRWLEYLVNRLKTGGIMAETVV